MMFVRVLLAAGALVSVTGPSLANGVPATSLNRQFAQAELVVLGTLGQRSDCGVPMESRPCVEISTERVLKGSPAVLGVRRYLLLSSSVPELSLEPVAGSGRVLLFLHAGARVNAGRMVGTRELFSPVLGRRSVLPVDREEVGNFVRNNVTVR